MALLIAILSLSLCKSVTNAVTITPSSHNQTGITVQTNGHSDITIGSNNGWSIAASESTGWDIHISMDKSWNFPSDRPSILTLKTRTSAQSLNILYAFGQSESSKYLISSFRNDLNYIYPSCDTLARGDIERILNDNELQSANNSFSAFEPNANPLTLQITNNPLDGFSKIDSCAFEAFSSDHPMDIYISVAHNDEPVNIRQFDLTLSYNATIDGMLTHFFLFLCVFC